MLDKLKYRLIGFISPIIPTDYFSRKYPVSVKGIISINGKFVLLKNERNEWELPGGKLEPDETAEQCVVREIEEELNLKTEVERIVDVWLYDVKGKVKVLIITYQCKHNYSSADELKVSHEHKEVGLFTAEEIKNLNMPDGYKNSINKVIIG